MAILGRTYFKGDYYSVRFFLVKKNVYKFRVVEFL